MSARDEVTPLAEDPGARKRAKAGREDRLVRDLVAGWDHDTVYALLQAAEGWAAVLTQVDHAFPDPDKRATAHRLGEAAALLGRANMARQWIEERYEGKTE